MKDDNYNVCTVCREDKGFKNSSLITENEQLDKTYRKGI